MAQTRGSNHTARRGLRLQQLHPNIYYYQCFQQIGASTVLLKANLKEWKIWVFCTFTTQRRRNRVLCYGFDPHRSWNQQSTTLGSPSSNHETWSEYDGFQDRCSCTYQTVLRGDTPPDLPLLRFRRGGFPNRRLSVILAKELAHFRPT